MIFNKFHPIINSMLERMSCQHYKNEHKFKKVDQIHYKNMFYILEAKKITFLS